jgi:hypothetical protein
VTPPLRGLPSLQGAGLVVRAAHAAPISPDWPFPTRLRPPPPAAPPPPQLPAPEKTPQWSGSDAKDAAAPRGWRGVAEAQEDWGELNTGKGAPGLFVLDTASWVVHKAGAGTSCAREGGASGRRQADPCGAAGARDRAHWAAPRPAQRALRARAHRRRPMPLRIPSGPLTPPPLAPPRGPPPSPAPAATRPAAGPLLWPARVDARRRRPRLRRVAARAGQLPFDGAAARHRLLLQPALLPHAPSLRTAAGGGGDGGPCQRRQRGHGGCGGGEGQGRGGSKGGGGRAAGGDQTEWEASQRLCAGLFAGRPPAGVPFAGRGRAQRRTQRHGVAARCRLAQGKLGGVDCGRGGRARKGAAAPRSVHAPCPVPRASAPPAPPPPPPARQASAPRTVVPVVARPARPGAFPGLYAGGFPEPAFLSDRVVTVNSQWYSQSVGLAVQLDTGDVAPVTPVGWEHGSWAVQVRGAVRCGAGACWGRLFAGAWN